MATTIDKIIAKLPDDLKPYATQAATILVGMAEDQLVALLGQLMGGTRDRRIGAAHVKYLLMDASQRADAYDDQNEAMAALLKAGALTQKQLLDIVKAMLLIALMLFKSKAGLE